VVYPDVRRVLFEVCFTPPKMCLRLFEVRYTLPDIQILRIEHVLINEQGVSEVAPIKSGVLPLG
jgi:hypothetical protein